MKMNRKTIIGAGTKTARAFALLLAAILLVTMLPLAGLAAGFAWDMSGSSTGSGPNSAGSGYSTAFLPSLTAYAEDIPTSGYCGDNAKWKYNTRTGELTVSGSGEMWDWDDPYSETATDVEPWYWWWDDIKTITIQSGITEIGTYCFSGCEVATKITIPSTVTAIWDGAFQGCAKVKSITIPNSVKIIADYAFTFCESLKEVTIPASVTDLSCMAFYYSPGNEKIHVASGNSTYKEIDGVVFLKSINELMIYPTGRADHIYTVPSGTTAIGSFAFCSNSNIRAVILPDSVIAIGSGAFMLDEHLLRVGLPASVELVDDYAFSGCQALRDVYYAGTQAQRSSIGISSKENEKFTGAVWHYQTSPKEVATALFEDVTDEAYYADAVKWAASAGVTAGTSDITFSPNNPCTRAQTVTFLWRAAGSPKPASMKHPFTDVPSGAYYEQAVIWAVEKNITNGMTATTFGPNQQVTRGQTVTFLYRWKGSPDISVTESNPFTDVNDSAFCYKPVLWAVKNGITNGTTHDTFAPGATCTRGQIVTFLYRAK